MQAEENSLWEIVLGGVFLSLLLLPERYLGWENDEGSYGKVLRRNTTLITELLVCLLAKNNLNLNLP